LGQQRPERQLDLLGQQHPARQLRQWGQQQLMQHQLGPLGLLQTDLLDHRHLAHRLGRLVLLGQFLMDL
jgi:hypothetical protein